MNCKDPERVRQQHLRYIAALAHSCPTCNAPPFHYCVVARPYKYYQNLPIGQPRAFSDAKCHAERYPDYVVKQRRARKRFTQEEAKARARAKQRGKYKSQRRIRKFDTPASSKRVGGWYKRWEELPDEIRFVPFGPLSEYLQETEQPARFLEPWPEAGNNAHMQHGYYKIDWRVLWGWIEGTWQRHEDI